MSTPLYKTLASNSSDIDVQTYAFWHPSPEIYELISGVMFLFEKWELLKERKEHLFESKHSRTNNPKHLQFLH